jgi:hypothetical protein
LDLAASNGSASLLSGGAQTSADSAWAASGTHNACLGIGTRAR